MKTTWQNHWQPGKAYPALRKDTTADVVVIGGGLAGVSLAYMLAKSGRKVIVLEKGTLRESSMTAYTTAMLAYEIDTDFPDLKRIFGERRAAMIWRSGREAIDTIENIVREESIDCEFRRVPEYLFGKTEGQWKNVKREAEAAQGAGFPLEIYEDGHEGAFHLPFAHEGFVRIPDQALFHPLRYVDALRQAAEKHGALFFEESEVKEIIGDNPIVVKTKEASVSASWAAVTTYYPFHNPRELFAKKGMYVSYVYELSIPAAFLPEAFFLDGENPYHYFRVDRGVDRDRLIIGGEDHRKEIAMDPEKNYRALLAYAEEILGGRRYEIVTRWTGGILETWDGIPFIGTYGNDMPHRLVATGFSGNGMTYSTVAARILSDRILGRPNPYAELYDPKRGYSFTGLLTKGRDYLGIFAHGALRNMVKKR